MEDGGGEQEGEREKGGRRAGLRHRLAGGPPPLQIRPRPAEFTSQASRFGEAEVGRARGRPSPLCPSSGVPLRSSQPPRSLHRLPAAAGRGGRHCVLRQRCSPAPASCDASRPLRPPRAHALRPRGLPRPPLPPSPSSPATAPGSRSTEMAGFGGPGSPATAPSSRSTEMAGFGVPGSPLPLPPPSSSLSVHSKSSS